MKPSKKTIEVLQLLNDWEVKNEIYSLYPLHQMEMYDAFEEFEYLNNWFNFDFTNKYQDRFLQFGTDGTGGAYCLWFYPDLDQEPPVVFMGSEGQTNIIASCMEDFVCLFTNGKILDANNTYEDTPKSLWTEIHNWQIEDLANEYKTSTKKTKKKLEESIAFFQKTIATKLTCLDEETIFKTIDKHPNFIKWIDEIRAKNENEIFNPVEEEDASSLFLGGKKLTEVPRSILDNIDITSLDLSDNQITEIPEFVSQLTKLKIIYLEDNQITKIPKFFEKFEYLEKLDLNNNKLTELKLDFTKMKSLEFLKVYENKDFNYIDKSIYHSLSLLSFDYEDTLLEKKLHLLAFIEKSISESILDDVEDIIDDFNSEKGKIPKKYKATIKNILVKRATLYPTSENYYKAARVYQYDFKKYKKAEKLYQKCLEIKDENTFEETMLVEFARLYYYHLDRDFDKAEKLYKEALTYKENYEYSLDQYASFLKFHKKDYKQVEKIYKKLIKLDKNHIPYFTQYAELVNFYYPKPKKSLKINKKLYKLTNKNKYRKKYAEILAFDLGEYEKALPIFSKLLKKKKSSNNYLNYILTLQNTKADKELIEKTIKKAYKSYPKDEFIIAEYKENLLENNDFSEFEKAITNNTALKKDYIQYAEKLVENKDFKKTKELIEKGLVNFPNSEMILAYKLQFLTKSDATNKEIVKLAKELLKITVEEGIIKKCEMIIASKTQNLDNLSAYDELITSKKGDIKALIKECVQGFVEKDFKKVLACAKAIEKIDASHPEMLSLYASLLTVTQSANTAIDFLRKKTAITNNSNAYIALADVYIRLQKEDELKTLLLTAKEKFPDDKNLFHYNAYIEEPKVIATNEKEFEILLKKEPNNIEYLREFAHYLLDNAKFLKAIKYYKKVIVIEEDFTTLWYISEAYFVLGNREKEEIYKTKALELEPMQLLYSLLKTKPTDLKKYSKIAQEKFPDNKEVNEFMVMMNKMM